MKQKPAVESILSDLHLRRDRAVQRLLNALAHLPRARQFAIITSWMSLANLENLGGFSREQIEDRPGFTSELTSILLLLTMELTGTYLVINRLFSHFEISGIPNKNIFFSLLKVGVE